MSSVCDPAHVTRPYDEGVMLISELSRGRADERNKVESVTTLKLPESEISVLGRHPILYQVTAHWNPVTGSME